VTTKSTILLTKITGGMAQS